jgi:hypothetical protein
VTGFDQYYVTCLVSLYVFLGIEGGGELAGYSTL